jgi:hypothetical protein
VAGRGEAKSKLGLGEEITKFLGLERFEEGLDISRAVYLSLLIAKHKRNFVLSLPRKAA